MSRKRTNVYADAEDLALIKEAARRRGVPEAEIIREGIRLAALGSRAWELPMVDEEDTVDLGGPVRRQEIREIMTGGTRASA